MLSLHPPGWGGNLLRGLVSSVEIAVGAFGLGLLIGVCGAWGKLYGGPMMRDLFGLYTTIVRAVPELVLILILYFAGTDLVNRLLDLFGYPSVDINGLVAGIGVLGVLVSTVHAVYAKKHFGASAAEIKEYQTQDEANQDLAAGRIDGTQADSIALDAFLKSDEGKACCDLKGYVAPDLEVLGPGVGAGVRKGDTELKDKINAAIKAIRADGKYAEITKKYFDFDIYGDDKQSN